jgi:squalene monooxygenase
MPNSYLPPHRQEGHPGVILMGDSLNMRHPLTGGGMTVALLDVEIISNLLGELDDFEDWELLEERLAIWHQQRKSTSTCINVLAQALYSLFGAEGDARIRSTQFQFIFVDR